MVSTSIRQLFPKAQEFPDRLYRWGSGSRRNAIQSQKLEGSPTACRSGFSRQNGKRRTITNRACSLLSGR